MAFDRDNDEGGVNRRHALQRMVWTGTGVVLMAAGGLSKSLGQIRSAQAAAAMAQTKPTIPIIVKNKTSRYWQLVLAGARKAGQDFGVNVIELGTDSETDAS